MASQRPHASVRVPGADHAGSPIAGIAMVGGAAASWGTWSLFLRPSHLPATVTAPLLFLVMGLVTLPIALRAPRATWDRAALGLVAAYGVSDALNVIAYFAALQYTTVAIAVLTHYFAPVLVALAAPRIDGATSRGAGPAAAVALAGLVVILEPWHAPGDGAVLGAALGLASAVCSAGNIFAAHRVAARIGASRALAYHSLVAAAAMAPLAAGHLDDVTPRGLGVVVAGAVTIGAVSGVVFTRGLLRIGSARAAVLTFIEPLVAVVVGAVVWHEPIHPTAVVGGALVLGAGFQVAREAR